MKGRGAILIKPGSCGCAVASVSLGEASRWRYSEFIQKETGREHEIRPEPGVVGIRLYEIPFC